MTISKEVLELKLDEALAATAPTLIARDVHVPAVPGKALAVIGVRRGGKTSFLAKHLADRVAQGRPREAHLLLSLEDERLEGMTVHDLRWLLEEHARRHPGVREESGLVVALDEAHLVPGWEGLVRRLVDEGGVEILVAGSSAKLLSREVATSLRGRAMEVLVHPFSFREALRLLGAEPTAAWGRLKPAERARLDQGLRRYLVAGGFPEAQRAADRDRVDLLRGYVDVVVLRDIIERHAVSNPLALRWLVRQLLANPGGSFSISKQYGALRSQGIAVGKDTLHAMLAHLEDAFLVRTVAMHSASERQRMVNPRKAYPIDPGLIPLFERTGRQQQGRALETVILLELERRGYDVAWVGTRDGWEVDFIAHGSSAPPLLVQVALEAEDGATWEREVRALASARQAWPECRALLITRDSSPPSRALPSGIEWIAAAHWLLTRDD